MPEDTFSIAFSERVEGRERKRERDILLVASRMCPEVGSKPQSKYVPLMWNQTLDP